MLKPICNGLCNCVYKFNCKLVFSTANKFTVKPIVLDYATVYISLIVNLYLAEQTGLQLNQFVMDYATVYISLIVNLYLARQQNYSWGKL